MSDLKNSLQNQQQALDTVKRRLEDRDYVAAQDELGQIDRHLTNILDELRDPSGWNPEPIAQSQLKDSTFFLSAESVANDFAEKWLESMGFPAGLLADLGETEAPSGGLAAVNPTHYRGSRYGQGTRLTNKEYLLAKELDKYLPSTTPEKIQAIIQRDRRIQNELQELESWLDAAEEQALRRGDRRINRAGAVAIIVVIIGFILALWASGDERPAHSGTSDLPHNTADAYRNASADVDNAQRHVATALREAGNAQRDHPSGARNVPESLATKHHAATASHECQEANDDLEDAVRTLSR
jgi:hypothetical protein